MGIQENLNALAQQTIKDRNFVNHYLTFRQQRSNRLSDVDALCIAGHLISIITAKRVDSKATIEKFINSSKKRLSNKIGDSDFEALLHEMYFENDAKGLYQVSPEFLLLKKEGAGSVNTKHVSSVLGGMANARQTQTSIKSKGNNFLEAELVEEFASFVVDQQPSNGVSNYLPFLAEVFSDDLAFLCNHPNYLMQNASSFINLYNFLYSAQLALNIKSWRVQPSSKPLFFILDTERASTERTHVRDALPALVDRVADLFPYLSALEYFNQPDAKDSDETMCYPLWMYYEYLNTCDDELKAEHLAGLSSFLNAYRDARQREPLNLEQSDIEDVISSILGTADEIFTQARSSQLTVNRKVVLAFENEVARHFIQNRRRGGRVLIINQDYLLLLTNLSIGNLEKLQFQQLIEEFKKRGVWFDQQSQQALVEFYERVGNLDRMSDSGDAVYVRKTI